MLEMASLGAKVLQTRSVETAMTNNVALRVLSSFANENKEDAGTIVTEEDAINCLLYTSPSPRDSALSRMPSSA